VDLLPPFGHWILYWRQYPGDWTQLTAQYDIPRGFTAAISHDIDSHHHSSSPRHSAPAAASTSLFEAPASEPLAPAPRGVGTIQASGRAAAKPPKPAVRDMFTQTEQTAEQEPVTRTAARLPGRSPLVTRPASEPGDRTTPEERATRTAAGLPGGSPTRTPGRVAARAANPAAHDVSTRTGQAAGRGGVTPGSARATTHLGESFYRPGETFLGKYAPGILCGRCGLRGHDSARCLVEWNQCPQSLRSEGGMVRLKVMKTPG